MRAFIAIDVPGDVKARVDEGRKGIDGEGLALVKRDAMHITLQFLGEISEEDAEKVKRAMGEIASAPFGASLCGVSYFSPNFIKTVFIQVAEGEPEIIQLYDRLCASLEGKGVTFERERSFKPHLTIARVKRAIDRESLLGWMGRNAKTDFGSFEVKSICLKKSTLTGEGPVYTTLYEREL